MELINIKGIGEATSRKLALLGINDVKDLLLFLPSSYIDLSCYNDMTNINDGNFSLMKGYVKKLYSLRRGFNRTSNFKAVIMVNNVTVNLTWFNQPYMYDKIKEKSEYTFFGKIQIIDNEINITNPIFENFGAEVKLKGILPIYKTEGLIHQANMRTFIKQALEMLLIPSLFNDYIDINSMLRIAHNPSNIDEGIRAKEKIAIEDIANTIINYRIIKRKTIKDKKRQYINTSYSELSKLLDYELTSSQITAIEEIINDLSNKSPMNRLLLGDVGSGKTIVSLIAAYIAIKNGYQAAIMAPTTILANQHNKSSEVLRKLGINVELLTGETTKNEKDVIINDVKNGEINLIIGTHSLLNDNLQFKKLGIVITDELHRFGVNQKNNIELKELSVDTLVMSATPIPRALALTLYNDLQVSIIERRSPVNIKTSIVPSEKINDMYKFLLEEVRNGRQAYIVCSRILDVEGIELVSLKSLYDDLKKGILQTVRLGLIYGSMKNDKKAEVMKNFNEGRIDVLVTTTVIEVGIDVPNATIMIIMDAERYGLAALHQLRGRVGRGKYQSYCLLCSDNSSSERLLALKANNDGLAIAEIDYDIRGGGDFIGLRQSGLGDHKITREMIIEAKRLSKKIEITNNLVESFSMIKNNSEEEIIKQVTMN